jgi:uncharacterized protein (TIGR03083 family)
MSDRRTKDELMSHIRTERAALESLVERLTDEQMTHTGVMEGWSIKDILAHVTWWEGRMIYLIETAKRGEKPQSLRREGEDQERATDRVNAEVFDSNRSRSLADVRDEFRRSGQQVESLIASLSDDDLDDDSPAAQTLGGSLRHLIAVNTDEHYREHAEMIAAWIDQPR